MIKPAKAGGEIDTMRRITIVFIALLILLGGCALIPSKAQADPKIPRFVTTKDIELVGTLTTTTMQNLQFTKYWEEFFPAYEITPHKKNDKFYGTMFMDQDTPFTMDTPINYLVGVPAKVIPDAKAPWTKHTIKGGTYVVFTHRGPVENIMETYMYIYNTWLPGSGYAERFGDQFEYYDERFKDQSPDSVVEIWVPVQKK